MNKMDKPVEDNRYTASKTVCESEAPERQIPLCESIRWVLCIDPQRGTFSVQYRLLAFGEKNNNRTDGPFYDPDVSSVSDTLDFLRYSAGVTPKAL